MTGESNEDSDEGVCFHCGGWSNAQLRWVWKSSPEACSISDLFGWVKSSQIITKVPFVSRLFHSCYLHLVQTFITLCLNSSKSFIIKWSPL